MSILTGQTKLNEALHDDACDGNWTLRVNDPCNAQKLDDLISLSTPSGAVQLIYNVNVLISGVEQSLVLPVSVNGYMIRTRGAAKLQLSHVSGESGAKFFTIPSRASYSDEHKYNNLILYFQCSSVDIVEVIVWT